jgi:DNA helicase-2/ATP-dependent DNA helicase PcrA
VIVDEYQDVNPAQEALIRLLGGAPVELCVVGDDDQSIYQFRGSDVNNIVSFTGRYPSVATFRMTTNRRSRPHIIGMANEFATTIKGRLPKTMGTHRDAATVEVSTWCAPTEAEEAAVIADSIVALHKRGYRYRDVGVLVRSSTSLERLLAALAARQIPVQPTSRTALFKQPEAQLFGQTMAFLADSDWRETPFGWGTRVTLGGLSKSYATAFGLGPDHAERVRSQLDAWGREAHSDEKPTNLVRNFYGLLSACGIAKWDLNDSNVVARLGALARCSSILVDYESVRRRSRRDEAVPGEVTGGQDRGQWYYRGLAIHVQNWALGAYEGFEGEDDLAIDAVDVTTIHKAKGLEWPVVFVPCVSANRFPSSRNGTLKDWRIPLDRFDRTRYEGTLNDERRLFYVAVTRARDWLSVSTHQAVTTRAVACSPFLLEFGSGQPPVARHLELPDPPDRSPDDLRQLMITFSELASFARCGFAYWLGTLIGFQPPLAPELGYGKAVHHVLRQVAEHTRRHLRVPTAADLDRLFDSEFYLPAANKSANRQMKAAARRIVDRYVDAYAHDLEHVWAVERPFELHLDDAVVSGRADVILDVERDELTLVDYKVSVDNAADHELQLRVYTEAGRLEGLVVTGAYLHDLKAGDRIQVDVTPQSIATSNAIVRAAIVDLRARRFTPRPGPICGRCDVREMCRHAV